MNSTKTIIKHIAISSLFLMFLSGQAAVNAQVTAAEPSSFKVMMNTNTVADKFQVPIERTNDRNQPGGQMAPGTDLLQDKVLMQINSGLVNGWLTIDQASEYKAELNKLNEEETTYKSVRMQIPASLIEANTKALNEMSQLLKPKALSMAKAENSLHSDMDELISNALAHKRISSSAAEKYYMRLAQIESKMESTKGNPMEVSVLNSNLTALKAELMHI